MLLQSYRQSLLPPLFFLYFAVFKKSGPDSSKGTVYVESVGMLTGSGNNTGVLNRFTALEPAGNIRNSKRQRKNNQRHSCKRR